MRDFVSVLVVSRVPLAVDSQSLILPPKWSLQCPGQLRASLLPAASWLVGTCPGHPRGAGLSRHAPTEPCLPLCPQGLFSSVACPGTMLTNLTYGILPSFVWMLVMPIIWLVSVPTRPQFFLFAEFAV